MIINIDFAFRFYKRYVSPLNPPSCRFYPTCSDYANIQFKFQNPLVALIKTTSRILRCNQLFNGGIEYPVVKLNIKKIKISHNNKANIIFWLIQKDKNHFYVIKSFKEN